MAGGSVFVTKIPVKDVTQCKGGQLFHGDVRKGSLGSTGEDTLGMVQVC